MHFFTRMIAIAILGVLPFGASAASVLQVGFGSTVWNDGSHTVTTSSSLSGLTLTDYDVIYITGSATSAVDPGQTAALDSYVQGGGGLIAESGGNISGADFSWLPLGGTVSAVTQHQNTVLITTLGQSHAITSTLTNAALSNWGSSQHNYFSTTGAFDVLATNGVGQANLLATDYGLGRIVFTGLDAVCCHLGNPGAVLVTQNSVAWVAEGASVSAVPLPASASLVLVAIGAFGTLRLRKLRSA